MIADVYDQKSLEDMCSQASVIINCVGPVSEGGYHRLEGEGRRERESTEAGFPP